MRSASGEGAPAELAGSVVDALFKLEPGGVTVVDDATAAYVVRLDDIVAMWLAMTSLPTATQSPVSSAGDSG